MGLSRTRDVDVIVVGLGHAGCEAALASARLGLRVLGVTLRKDRIALMSCNPAIGGTAKGHLVRELDALGGEMGAAADDTGTHFKTLNASKGPAVQATRVLCDRAAYAARMARAVLGQPRLDVVEGEVTGLLAEDGAVRGVRLGDREDVAARAVILTTGTFLQALMHVGERQDVGGRLGDAAATGLSGELARLGFTLGRFKTGTPPRLIAQSIDWSRCAVQPSDPQVRPFSARTQRALERGQASHPRLPQLDCYVTHTTPETHAAVRGGLARSPLFTGQIQGRGPRYCPSLEDKVVRFAQKQRHAVFLEPEGVGDPWVYPAGLSTSLPADIQEAFLRTIPGLEQVEIARHGYAVEYDYAPPTQLDATLQARRIRGLFFAGQLNGTSGYEEAAFQGLLAGINAAQALRGERPVVLGREQAHGGVLLDALVTSGVDEPFRMLTSRSEHRLKLRESNADLRLTPLGRQLGLVASDLAERTEQRRAQIAAEVAELERAGLLAALRRPEATLASVRGEAGARVSPDVAVEVEAEVKYAGYIAQNDRQLARLGGAEDGWRIPASFTFHDIQGLSAEARERLERARPVTVGQARRIPGLTPAALSLLLVHLKRRESGPNA